MQITKIELRQTHTTRALLREYFPRADRRAVDEYVEALQAYRLFATHEALTRLVTAQHLIIWSLPTINLEEL